MWSLDKFWVLSHWEDQKWKVPSRFVTQWEKELRKKELLQPQTWISEQDVDQMRIKAFWEKQPLTEEKIDQMRENAFPSVLQRIKNAVNKIFNQEK
jgi:hypothetical protein